MDWLRRRMGRTDAPAEPDPASSEPESFEGAAPGVAALLDGVSEDGSHAVLDLGAASPSGLDVYSRFARRMRFADLLGRASNEELGSAVSALPDQRDHPYDLIFGWNVLDRLTPDGHRLLVERLARVSAPNARLHVVVESAEGAMTRPLRLTLLDVGRMRYEPTGPARPSRPRLQPGEVERLLDPFRVVRAFTLKAGLREYVAFRGD